MTIEEYGKKTNEPNAFTIVPIDEIATIEKGESRTGRMIATGVFVVVIVGGIILAKELEGLRNMFSRR